MSGNRVNKIVISVLHVNRNPWKRFVDEIQIPFWKNQSLEDISISFFYCRDSQFFASCSNLIEKLRWRGTRYSAYAISYFLKFVLLPFRSAIPPSKLVLEDSFGFKHFVVNCPEMTSTMRWKRIAIFDYFLKTDGEFLVMLTSTSLLNIQSLKFHLSQLIDCSQSDTKPLAAGPIGQSADGNFISGSFVVLGRNTVELLLQNLCSIPVHSMDDIALSVGVRNLGVELQVLPSLNLESEEQITRLTKDELVKFCHIRTSRHSYFGYLRECSRKILEC